MRDDRSSTLRNAPAVTPGQLDHGLIVIVSGVVSTHALPKQGVVNLGRAKECDVQVIDPSVSRNHARLHVGLPIARDLGSPTVSVARRDDPAGARSTSRRASRSSLAARS